MSYTEEAVVVDGPGIEKGKEIVCVFVRKDSEESRTLSFLKPKLSIWADKVESEVLNRGLAFDGRNIIKRVTRFTFVQHDVTGPGNEPGSYFVEGELERDLFSALADAEIMIRDWLSGRDMVVYFV